MDSAARVPPMPILDLGESKNLKWRREGDSNPRYFLGTHAFQACALNHSAISPPGILNRTRERREQVDSGQRPAFPEPGLEYQAEIRHIGFMSTVTIELESDALKKLESARLSPEETFSDVVRRAEFPLKPWLARDLLDDLKRRAGFSPLTEEALDCLSKAQSNPSQSPSHWGES